MLKQFTRTDSQNPVETTPRALSRLVQGCGPFARNESKSDNSTSIVANSVCYLENFVHRGFPTGAISIRAIEIRAFIPHLQRIELTGRFSRQCLLLLRSTSDCPLCSKTSISYGIWGTRQCTCAREGPSSCRLFSQFGPFVVGN